MNLVNPTSSIGPKILRKIGRDISENNVNHVGLTITSAHLITGNEFLWQLQNGQYFMECRLANTSMIPGKYFINNL